MGLFKSKIEREMEEQIRREEQLQVFDDQIKQLKASRQQYARIAAEAEVNNDKTNYQNAVNALIFLNEQISYMTGMKTNYDIINMSNSLASNLAMAIGALDVMANSKNKMPDIKKLSKTNLKLKQYMKQIQISQKSFGKVMQSSNPANKTISEEELQSVKPLIDAERMKITGGTTIEVSAQSKQKETNDEFDLSKEINEQKNRFI
jgi:hypothetical protein